jgi:phospholipid transport system substrate-binding protein
MATARAADLSSDLGSFRSYLPSPRARSTWGAEVASRPSARLRREKEWVEMPLPLRGLCRTVAFAAVLASAPLAHPARAADDASAFIVLLGQQAIATMTNETISSGDRLRRFAVIVNRDFDVPKIAKFMLGHDWQNASDSERADFTNVFRDYMIRIYSDNFSRYRSDSFHVLDQRPSGDTATIVRTDITPYKSGQPMTVEWLVLKTPDGFKVADLSVAGASLAVAQQEEFASALRHDDGQVALLIGQVRSKLAELEMAGQ